MRHSSTLQKLHTLSLYHVHDVRIVQLFADAAAAHRLPVLTALSIAADGVGWWKVLFNFQRLESLCIRRAVSTG
jgi:hypothetical protein